MILGGWRVRVGRLGGDLGHQRPNAKRREVFSVPPHGSGDRRYGDR